MTLLHTPYDVFTTNFIRITCMFLSIIKFCHVNFNDKAKEFSSWWFYYFLKNRQRSWFMALFKWPYRNDPVPKQTIPNSYLHRQQTVQFCSRQSRNNPIQCGGLDGWSYFIHRILDSVKLQWFSTMRQMDWKFSNKSTDTFGVVLLENGCT